MINQGHQKPARTHTSAELLSVCVCVCVCVCSLLNQLNPDRGVRASLNLWQGRREKWRQACTLLTPRLVNACNIQDLWPGVRTPGTHTCRRANHQHGRYRHTRGRTGCNFQRKHLWPWEGRAWRASDVSRLTPAECVSCWSEGARRRVLSVSAVFFPHNLRSDHIHPFPPRSVSATQRHGNYGPKLAQYFMEWHFSLSSISALTTQFSAHALGSIVQLLSHFLFPLLCLSGASPSLLLALCVVPPFLNSFITLARQKSLLMM